MPPPPLDLQERRRCLRQLRHKRQTVSPTANLLYELMGFGHFSEIAMTRDGLLIGQLHRESGFDAFIGSPTKQMLDQVARIWLELDAHEQHLVLERLSEQAVQPERIGIRRPNRRASRAS